MSEGGSRKRKPVGRGSAPFGLLPLLDLEPKIRIAKVLRGRPKPLPGAHAVIAVQAELPDGRQREVDVEVTSFMVTFGLHALAICPECRARAFVLYTINDPPYVLCWVCRGGTYFSVRRGHRPDYGLVERPLHLAQLLRRQAAREQDPNERQRLLNEAEEHLLAAEQGALCAGSDSRGTRSPS